MTRRVFWGRGIFANGVRRRIWRCQPQSAFKWLTGFSFTLSVPLSCHFFLCESFSVSLIKDTAASNVLSPSSLPVTGHPPLTYLPPPPTLSSPWSLRALTPLSLSARWTFFCQNQTCTMHVVWARGEFLKHPQWTDRGLCIASCVIRICVTLLWMMILIQEADHALFWFCSLLSLFLSVISSLPSTDALMVWQLRLMLIISSSISVHNCVRFVHKCVCVCQCVSVCPLFAVPQGSPEGSWGGQEVWGKTHFLDVYFEQQHVR